MRYGLYAALRNIFLRYLGSFQGEVVHAFGMLVQRCDAGGLQACAVGE